MHRKTLCAMALAVAWSAPLSARAEDAELTKIRDEIRQMKEAYEKRIEALEKRLQETEAKAGQAADSAAQAQSAASTATQTAIQASSRPAAENALNPGISAILNGVYSNLKQDPNTYRINGFVPTMGDVGPGRRGLSLGESELGFTANIDHMFRGSHDRLDLARQQQHRGRRRATSRPSACPTDSASRRGASFRRWATRTRSTRTPGFHRCAAGNEGVPRQPAERRRHPGEVGRTHRPVFRRRHGSGARPSLPPPLPAATTRTASLRELLHAPGAAISVRASRGRRGSPISPPRRGTGPTPISIPPGRR